jgi:hypothetical protein
MIHLSNRNKIIKSVAFNTNNEDEAKMVKAIRRRNFSGYVKKLIWADLQTKEEAKRLASQGLSPTPSTSNQTSSYREEPSSSHAQSHTHHQESSSIRNTSEKSTSVDNPTHNFSPDSHTYDNNHISYGHKANTDYTQAPPTYPSAPYTPEAPQDRREAAREELARFRRQNMGGPTLYPRR